MPIKKSAKKYMRVTNKKTIRNKKVKGVSKNALKKTREAIAAGDVDEAKKWLAASIKSFDKAVQKKIMKKNTAARKKSRLNKAVKAIVKK
jgi:small subunit ribosomal protein S20